MEKLAQTVKERAAKLALSQAEVARRCGVTERAFNHYMSGRSEPNLSTLLRIAIVLDCTPNDLLGVTSASIKTDAKGALRAQISAASQVMDVRSLRLALSLLNCIVESQLEAGPQSK